MRHMPEKTKEIFLEALDLPEGEREGYVRGACAGDDGRIGRVLDLVVAHAGAGAFMSDPTSGGAPDVTTPMIEPGDRIGVYRIVRKLGEGGFGVVFLAEQERPVARPVAIKILKLGMDTRELIARFEAERQALAMMDHPGIATVFDAGATDTGRPYFVMEHVAGESVVGYCDRERMGVAGRLELFERICHAVQHAHQKGVIHRDLKPNNVLVTVVDGRPSPKIIDFGIAKAIGAKLTDDTLVTRQWRLLGTPQYMSPEQVSLSQNDADTRTDVYSLGVLLYELLTGVPPFDQERIGSASMAELERIIREEQPARPSARVAAMGVEGERVARQRATDPVRLRRELRSDLDWVVMRAMEKDRARRYPTAYALAADVRRHLENEAVEAGPPSRTYRTRKLLARHSVAASIAAVIVLVLAAATIVSTSMGLAAIRAGRDASEAGERAEALRVLAEARSYVANMYAAGSALRLNDSEGARRHLDAAPEMGRGWEWRHLDAQIEESESVIRPAPGKTETTAWSTDGRAVAAAWPDNIVRVFDAADGRELHALRGHDATVMALVFAPDDSILISGDQAGSLIAWDLESGSEAFRFEGHTSRVVAAMFAPGGARLVSSSWDGTVRIWDAVSGEPVRTFEAPAALSHLDVSRDGTRLAAGCWDQKVYLWDLRTGETIGAYRCHRPETEPEPARRWAAGRINDIEFSPDDRLLAVGTADGRIRLFDASDGSEVPSPGADVHLVRRLAFSPDGGQLAVANLLGEIWVFGPPGLSEETVLRDHGDDVRWIEFLPGTSRSVSCSWDQTLRLWDTAAGRSVSQLRGHSDVVYRVVPSPDGSRVMSHSEDGTVRIWSTAGHVREVVDVREDHVLSVDLCDTTLVTGTRRGPARLFDTATRTLLRELGEEPARAVAIGSDGRLVATSGPDHAVTLWDARTGGAVRRLVGHSDDVRALRIASDTVLSCSQDRSVRTWDATTGEEIVALTDLPDRPQAGALSSDGRIGAAALSRAGVIIWDTRTGRELHRIRPPDPDYLMSVGLSPDGELVAFGGWSRLVYIAETRTGRITQTLRGHGDAVTGAAWLPDGSRLVTASQDRTLRLWDLGLGESVGILFGHTDMVRALAVSPDGTLIASGGEDASARMWHARPQTSARK
jgi:WD40 repeat protein/serine/threonine protein kinase